MKLTVGVISGNLDWSHRQKTSNANFNLAQANTYIRKHVDHNLELMMKAAQGGASLVVGPEYFTGSELFTTSLEQKKLFVDRPDRSYAIERLQEIAAENGAYLACAMHMFHDNELVETGVFVHPDSKTVEFQLKNTAMSAESRLPAGYRLFEFGKVKSGLLTCSDFDTYPEDYIDLAKRGMQLVMLPGCGFNGEKWLHYLIVRATDLSCPILYADDKHAAIVNIDGTIVSLTEKENQSLTGEVELIEKEPVKKLKSRMPVS